jgi:hypothetical protein
MEGQIQASMLTALLFQGIKHVSFNKNSAIQAIHQEKRPVIFGFFTRTLVAGEGSGIFPW